MPRPAGADAAAPASLLSAFLHIRLLTLAGSCMFALALLLSLAPQGAAARESDSLARKGQPGKPAVSRAGAAGKGASTRTQAASAKTRVASAKAGLAGHPVGKGRSAQVRAHGGRVQKVRQVARVIEPAKPSIGQAIGLHSVEDPLGLASSVALVADATSGQVLYEKNGGAVLPIASITKLMTALVVLDSRAPLQTVLDISEDDRDQERNSRSRLPIGARLTRQELLHLALMASENRAASALARHHPGGEKQFVQEMNAKAQQLGLSDTHFTESTGLSSANVSTARDLSRLVQAASRYPAVRELSTASELAVEINGRTSVFRNTNRLVGAESWGVMLQKTGYISEAGRCLVMMARWADKPVIMVFLDSSGRHSRLGDAQRVREWLDRRPTQSRVPVGFQAS